MSTQINLTDDIPAIRIQEGGLGFGLIYVDPTTSHVMYQARTGTIYDLTTSASTVTKSQIDALLVDAATLDSHDSLYFAKQSDLDTVIDIVVPSTLLTNIKTVDGAGSGLDADMLDGQEGSYYAQAAASLVTHQADITTHSNYTSTVGTPLATAASHIANTSNPHSVTATQVGKDTAQWNANKILGTTIPALSASGALTSDGVGGLAWTPGGGGGEVNTASNLGSTSGRVGIFSAKSGVDLQYKSLTSSGRVVLTTAVTGEINIGTSVVLADSDITDGSTKVMMLATERTKLTGIATAATANDTDANLKARANHTGIQSGETVIDAPIVVTASTLTLDATHRNKTIICNNTANLVITIPQTVFDSYPGCSITILRKSATYTVTITAAAGVTLNGTVAASKSISTQYKWASLYYEGSQVWNIAGDVA